MLTMPGRSRRASVRARPGGAAVQMGHWLLAFVSALRRRVPARAPGQDDRADPRAVRAASAAGRCSLGAAVAFALQAVIAVALGSAITPAAGAGRGRRRSRSCSGWARSCCCGRASPTDPDEADAAASARAGTPFLRAAAISFGTLFLTEWGDASQVTAIGVAARYASPVAVGLGAFLALMSVTVLALLVGRKLRAAGAGALHPARRGGGVRRVRVAGGVGGPRPSRARDARAAARSPVVLTMATRKSARCARVTSSSPRSQPAKTSIVPLTRVSAPSSRSPAAGGAVAEDLGGLVGDDARQGGEHLAAAAEQGLVRDRTSAGRGAGPR